MLVARLYTLTIKVQNEHPLNNNRLSIFDVYSFKNRKVKYHFILDLIIKNCYHDAFSYNLVRPVKLVSAPKNESTAKAW